MGHRSMMMIVPVLALALADHSVLAIRQGEPPLQEPSPTAQRLAELVDEYIDLADRRFSCQAPDSVRCGRAMTRRGGLWVELRMAVEALDRARLPIGRRIDLDVLAWRASLGEAHFLDTSSRPGRPSYRAAILQHTGEATDPARIHELGLHEVARLREAMEALVRQQNPAAHLDELLAAARTDPRLYARSPDELEEVATAIATRIEASLAPAFDLLPAAPFSVVVPRRSSNDVMAFYARSGPSGRGIISLNPDPTQVPLFLLEALLVHEAMPGHHLQQSLALEGQSLPGWRRRLPYTAYVEGWGLYAESLGEELGIYRHPLMDFGRLNLEMWRALRLVIDTGIHAFDWDLRQATELFRSHTALPERQIRVEVERYRDNPGQAVAYKVGEQRFQALRSRAEAALEKAFDLPGFHAAVLEHGPMPMRSLNDVVDAWILQRGGESTR